MSDTEQVLFWFVVYSQGAEQRQVGVRVIEGMEECECLLPVCRINRRVVRFAFMCLLDSFRMAWVSISLDIAMTARGAWESSKRKSVGCESKVSVGAGHPALITIVNEVARNSFGQAESIIQFPEDDDAAV